MEQLWAMDAEVYLRDNFIDLEDWESTDMEKQQRIVNVAQKTLHNKYPSLTIPNEAVYEFAGTLSVAFNDLNRYKQSGASSFSVPDSITISFDKNSPSDLESLISIPSKRLIEKANGITLSGVRVGRSR
jgi:hypothetical protein